MKKYQVILRLVLTFLLSVIAFLCSEAQFSQLGNKLFGTGANNGTTGPYQGYSVSLSSDGKTMAVGGNNDNSGIGATWVYTLSGSNWIQIGNKIVGKGAIGSSIQGASVCLSADGKTLAIGGSGDSSGYGAVWIYKFANGNWSQMGSKIVGSGAVGNAFQGISVSISSNGKTLAVGGHGDDNGKGAVWIFTLVNEIWTQKGNKLVGSGANNDVWGSQQGSSICLSSDGKTLAIGGQNDNNAAGAVWIFTLINDSWTQMGNKLVGSGAKNDVWGSHQGSSVSLSSDGKTLAVGASGDSLTIGATWVYTLSGSNWTQMGRKLVGTGIGSGNQPYQGWSVNLSGDGKTLAVGGENDNNGVGAVWIFTLTGSNWSQFGSKLVGTGGINQQRQGWSISLSSNGKLLVSGAPYDNFFLGAVWVFTAPGWNSDTLSSGGDTTEIITSDTLSISGTVHQGTGLLTDGIVMAIEKSTNKSKILRVTNGNFILDSLAKGNYILYAIPNPVTVTNYLPTFYVNKVKLKDAVTLSLQGHIRSVDIYLAALNTSVTGTYTITGRFSYEDGNSRDSSDFKTNWFSQTNVPTTPIAVSTNTCNTMPVLLYNSQNSLLQSTVTDSSGYFTFKNLPAGTYKVLGQRNKYASKNEGLVVVGNNPNEIVRLSMESVVTDFEDELSPSTSQILTYPNPFNQEIQTKGYAGEISVVDVTGKLVLQTTLQENETISTTSWPAGFYILKAGNTIQKLIKQ